MSRGVPSKWNLFKQFLSNPVGLVIYGLFNIIVASYLASNAALQITGVVAITAVFVVSGWLWAGSKHTEAFLQSFPGQVRFSRVLCRISIQNDAGDADIYYSFDGKNESNEPRRKMSFEVTHDENSTTRGPVKGTVDGKSTEWQTSSQPKSTTIIFDFGDRCGPHKPLPHHTFVIPLKRQFRQAFDAFYSWSHRPNLLTDDLTIELNTALAVYVAEVSENVTDFWGEPDVTELRRLKETSYARKLDEHNARIEVGKPLPTDTYYLLFKLGKAPEGIQEDLV